MNTIEINGVLYRRTDEVGDLSIIIADTRGLTFVGNAKQDGEWTTIYNARCVIRWGTSEHLAELAEDGPRENTRLGRQRDVIIRTNSIVAIYRCSKKWE